MVRPTQLLYPQRDPAPTRPAATVLLLRDTAQGIEVLMTRRSMTASFAPGAHVFPGGGIDATGRRLETDHPSAAARVPEGLDATLTVLTLSISHRLRRTPDRRRGLPGTPRRRRRRAACDRACDTYRR